MSFVGIISNDMDYEYIKQELLKDKRSIKLNLININKNNIQNIKNVKFETIVMCEDLKEMKKQENFVDTIINKANFLLINTDNNVTELNIENNKIQIITYGMNQKATVTASSIKDDEMLVCLQRNIKNVNNKIIEMQEFKRKAKNNIGDEVYNLLIIFILEQLYM